MMAWEDIKKYFWYLFGIIGVVYFWAGVWDGVGNIGPLKNPLYSFIAGVVLLSLSRVILKDANPLWGLEKPAKLEAKKVHRHPQKPEFHFKYKDHVSNKEIMLHAKNLKKIEKEFLVFLDRGKEIFIPLHRVTQITHKGKTHWKA
ncbi:MAG: hypothetical protein AABX64_00495 [Nanoarchaeota archaeon]